MTQNTVTENTTVVNTEAAGFTEGWPPVAPGGRLPPRNSKPC